MTVVLGLRGDVLRRCQCLRAEVEDDQVDEPIVPMPVEPLVGEQQEPTDEEKLRQSGKLRWGIFRLSLKAQGRGRGQGVEVECCMHRKSQVTGCKKWLACAPGRDLDYCVRLAKSWCLQGLIYKSQWEHVYLADVWSQPDSHAQLDQRCTTEVPWSSLGCASRC